MDNASETLKQRVAERMDALKLKPAPLAKHLGFDPSYIRDIFRRDMIPTAPRLAKMAAALHTTPEYLLGETDQVEPDAGLGATERRLLDAFAALDDDLKPVALQRVLALTRAVSEAPAGAETDQDGE